MARVITLTDDLDGSAGAKERFFSIENTKYSIDLTDENWGKLLTAMRPFYSVAKVQRVIPRTNRAPQIQPDDHSKIRAWAEANGIKLAARGRFPSEVVRAYYDEAIKDVGVGLAEIGMRRDNESPDFLEGEPLELEVVVVKEVVVSAG